MTNKKPASHPHKADKTVAAKRRPVAPAVSRTAKPLQKLDVTPASKVVPSATARPVIAPALPVQSDNTLTRTPSAPMIHKRIMVNAPPSGMASQTEIQSIGLEVPRDGDKASKAAPALQTAPAKPGSRTISIKPIETGPTIAELLKAKQQAVDKPADADNSDKPAVTKVTVLPIHKAVVKPAGKPETKPAAKLDDKPNTKADIKPAAAPAPEPATAADPASEPSAPEEKPDDELGGLGGKLGESDEVETAPEPLPSSPRAELYGGKPVIIIHESHPVREFMKVLVVFIFSLAVLLVVLNFLLDAGVVTTGYDLPHTNLLEP